MTIFCTESYKNYVNNVQANFQASYSDYDKTHKTMDELYGAYSFHGRSIEGSPHFSEFTQLKASLPLKEEMLEVMQKQIMDICNEASLGVFTCRELSFSKTSHSDHLGYNELPGAIESLCQGNE